MLPQSAETVVAIEGFTYRVLAGGIHEFTLSESKIPQKALDTFFDHLEILFAPDGVNALRRILVIFDENVPSINRLMQRARQLTAGQDERPPTRIAVLAPPDPLMQLMDTMLRMMRVDERRHPSRIFKREQYTEALAWVVAD